MRNLDSLTGIGRDANRRWRYLLMMVLNLLLITTFACSLSGLFGGEATPFPETVVLPATPSPPTPTPQPLPPALVESDPQSGVYLPLDHPVTLYFNQPMEQTSVERALSINPAMSGAFSWTDDATLVFTPEESLPPDSEIAFNVSTEARSASGLSLSNPVQVIYQTADQLRLTHSLPEPEAVDVDPTSAVMATFNQPVVPIGVDPASTLPGFTIDPAPQGRGEWLNTSTYIFYPDLPLSGGRTYSVLLNPNLMSTNGSPLESIESWSFSTASPRVVSIKAGVGDAPLDSALIPLDSEFSVAFNQPMDPLSMETNFSLTAPGLEVVPGEINWSEDFSEFTFVPDRLLARNSVYTLAVSPQAQARGGTTLAESASVQYRTVPTLAVVGTDPADSGTKRQYGALSLFFNGPVGEEDVLRHISIDPEVSNLSGWWNEADWIFNIYGDFTPQAKYVLTVTGDLPDPWGGTLAEPYIFNFTTAPLEPELILTTGSDVLFLTPRDNSISAQITNIYNLPTSIGSVGLSDFLAMVSGEDAYNLRQQFRSPDQIDWVQTLNVEPNRSQRVDVYLSQERNPLESGLYYLKFRPPGERIYAGPYLLVVSDVHMTYKLSATDALVWAVDLRTKQPIPGAPVTIYDERGNILAAGLTDGEGIYRSPIPKIENPYNTHYAMLGQPGEENFGLVLSTWSQGLGPWNFGIPSDFSGPRLEAYLYTDRPIYRPGQTVFFRAVVREAHNGRYQLPELSNLPLTLYKDYGEEVTTFDLPLSIFGTAHGEYPLPDEAQPGFYRLANDDNQYRMAVSFQVAEYRKPEINIRVDFSTDEILAGDTLVADVSARYFFDAPAGGIPVKWTLLEAPATFRAPGYHVGLEDTRWLDAFYLPGPGMYLGDPIDQGEATTNLDGLLTLELPTGTTDQRKLYTLEVTAQDESGLPVSARSAAGVNPAEFYIGVRPDAWVGRAGESMGFDVQVVDWNQSPAGERALRAEFSKVVWEREESAPDDSYFGFRYTPNYTLVDSADGSTDERGQARLSFTPPEPGTYQLDLIGGGARTEMILWFAGQGQAIWPSLPNQRLQLTPDQKEYSPGDTAQIFIPNPYGRSILALVTIERGVVLRHQQVEIEAGGLNLSLQLGEEDTPNVYLSVTLLDQDRSGRPDFRQGYVNLPVEPDEFALNVELIKRPERAGPGEELTFDVLVTDANGAPVQGEFSLAVVDLAALALAEPNVTDILSAFYGQQALGVQTGLALAAYAQRRTELPEGLGGGGGGGEMVEPVVREEFPDTAYWHAEVVTDEEGRAQVGLVLPDSLTTWQTQARVVTADTRVGEAEIKLVSSKDLIIRPVVP
ncbi:MAG: Ig-like domain-containing protein, partial [Anaerolineales bacterium]